MLSPETLILPEFWNELGRKGLIDTVAVVTSALFLRPKASESQFTLPGKA